MQNSQGLAEPSRLGSLTPPREKNEKHPRPGYQGRDCRSTITLDTSLPFLILSINFLNTTAFIWLKLNLLVEAYYVNSPAQTVTLTTTGVKNTAPA
jgi:hypothetical protein